MSLTYSIQGFDLHQPDKGFKLLVGSSFAPPVSPRRVDLELPHMHGQVPLWDDPLSAQKLTLKVRIEDPDPAGLQQKWEHLRSLMWTGSNRGLTIRRVMAGQVTSAFGQLETMNEPDFWLARGMIDVVMLFNIPYGRWQSIESYEHELEPTQGKTVEVPFVADSTAPVTDALFRVEGPTQSNWSFSIEDRTSRTGFSLNVNDPLDEGEYVIVDPGNYSVWYNGDDPSWDARDVSYHRNMIPRDNGALSMVSIPSLKIGERTTDIFKWSFNIVGAKTLVRGRKTYI